MGLLHYLNGSTIIKKYSVSTIMSIVFAKSQPQSTFVSALRGNIYFLRGQNHDAMDSHGPSNHREAREAKKEFEKEKYLFCLSFPYCPLLTSSVWLKFYYCTIDGDKCVMRFAIAISRTNISTNETHMSYDQCTQ